MHRSQAAALEIGILEGCGLTETASTTTFSKSVTDRRAYSVGKPIWGTQTQVRDSEGDALPPGKDNVGEVVTRGLAYCRERVAADKLPKNTLGKILKAELAPHGSCGGPKVMMRKLS